MQGVRQCCLAVLIFLAIAPPAALAAPGLSEAQQEALDNASGPRPDIHSYQRQDQFVTDLLAWQARREQLKKRLEKGESLSGSAAENEHDWHHVTGPEDLDTAISNAKGYQQPRYRELRRFDRTTHISFPLDPLEQEQLADKALSAENLPQPTLEEDIPESILQDNARLQRVMAASKSGQPLPTMTRQQFVGHSELR